MDLCNASLGIMVELSILLLRPWYRIIAGKKYVKRKSLHHIPLKVR